MTLQARRCPTCHSIGAPRVGHEDQLCADAWHDRPIGCPKCGTILNATAANCDGPWHADNQPDIPRLPDHGTTPWLDAFTSISGEVVAARMLPVVEAAKAWVAAIRVAGEDDDWADEPYISLGAALFAAVDQMATPTVLSATEPPRDDVPHEARAERDAMRTPADA